MFWIRANWHFDNRIPSSGKNMWGVQFSCEIKHNKAANVEESITYGIAFLKSEPGIERLAKYWQLSLGFLQALQKLVSLWKFKGRKSIDCWRFVRYITFESIANSCTDQKSFFRDMEATDQEFVHLSHRYDFLIRRLRPFAVSNTQVGGSSDKRIFGYELFDVWTTRNRSAFIIDGIQWRDFLSSKRFTGHKQWYVCERRTTIVSVFTSDNLTGCGLQLHDLPIYL